MTAAAVRRGAGCFVPRSTNSGEEVRERCAIIPRPARRRYSPPGNAHIYVCRNRPAQVLWPELRDGPDTAVDVSEAELFGSGCGQRSGIKITTHSDPKDVLSPSTAAFSHAVRTTGTPVPAAPYSACVIRVVR